ncbi:MAG: MFS transporter [Dehalococcoidia bacterium]|jgi:GPH family glycoside/pentoside/hexuronide:cation symporter
MGNATESQATRAPHSKLPLGIKLSFGIGDIGSNIFIVTTGMYLLFFMTNVMGINPALAGTMLLFPKLWDVISDPLMGAISDVTRSRFGRRRVYLLYGAVPFGLSFFILFLAPGFQMEFANALQTSLLFALGCTAFTVINVPYASMVPEMSDDYNERLSIVSFRMTFASIGALLAGGLTMALVAAGGGGADGFRFMGGIFGLVIIVSCLWCFFGTSKAPSLPPHKETPPVKEQVKIAARNYPFVILMTSYFLQALAIGVMMAGFVYYVKYAMTLPETAMNIAFPIFMVTGVIFIPVWLAVGKRLGKIRSYYIGLAIFTLSMGSLFFTSSSQLMIFYAQIFIAGIGFSSFQLFPFSMLPDTVEYDQLQSGMRREGIFSGMWSAGQKIAYSVGPPIVGFALALSGFVTDGVQPESVATGVRIVFCLFPAAMILLSFLPFSKYKMTEEEFEKVKAKISDAGKS